jgi:hypothetical protein
VTNRSVAKALDGGDSLEEGVRESRFLQGFIAETQIRLTKMDNISQQHPQQYEQLGKRQRIRRRFCPAPIISSHTIAQHIHYPSP